MTHPKSKKDDCPEIDLAELSRLLGEMGAVFPEDSELYIKALTEIERHPRSHEKPFRDMTLKEKIKRILELPRDVHRWAYLRGRADAERLLGYLDKLDKNSTEKNNEKEEHY